MSVGRGAIAALLVGLGAGCLGRSTLETDEVHYATPGSNFTCIDDGAWTSAAPLLRPRSGGVLVALRPGGDGKGGALLAGGMNDQGAVAFVERYDERYDAWHAQGELALPRVQFQGTLLEDGRVLFTGGVTGDAPDAGVALAEIYDPMKEEVLTATPMPEGRYLHSAALMDDGRVLVAGGFRDGAPAQTVFLFDPKRNKWIDIDAPASVRGGYVAIVPNSEGAWVLTADGVFAFDGYDFEALSGISSKVKLDVPVATDRHDGFLTIDARGNVWVLSPVGLRSTKIWSSAERVVTPSAVLALCEDVFLFADQRYRVSVGATGPVIEERAPMETEAPTGARLASGALLVVGGKVEGATSKRTQIFR